MEFKCKLVFENNLDHGDIWIDNQWNKISKLKNKEISFTVKGNQKNKVLALKNLDAGLSDGIKIISCQIDNYIVDDPKKFISFHMIGNPYVQNDIINEDFLLFNGELFFQINHEELFWLPHYYSDKEIDFVFTNNVHTCTNDDGCFYGESNYHTQGFYNLPYLRKYFNEKFSTKNIALGCSMTYGTGLKKSLAWPHLMGIDNFGVAGLGIDGIFYNAISLIEKFKPNKMVILFPNMSRRLLKIKSGNFYFRIPQSINVAVDSQYDRDYYLLSQKLFKEKREILLEKMVNDVDYLYSKEYLEKISNLPVDIAVSSWDKETYKQLPAFFKKILPFFEKIDIANDKEHYGPESHGSWVKKIKQKELV